MSKNELPVVVAVGVIVDDVGKVLIAKRADGLHQGGLWEFPGGKVERGETIKAALTRELFEELGIQLTVASPLVRVEHDYGDKQVVLDVWKVSAFVGEAKGVEGQPIRWVAIDDLSQFEFPAANQPILAELMSSSASLCQ